MKSNIGLILALAIGSLGVLVLAPGCKGGVTVEDLCEDVCSCGEGCGTSVDECVQSGEEAQRQAKEAGCLDQFNGYMQCVSDHFECVGGSASFPSGCVAALNAYSDCISETAPPQPG